MKLREYLASAKDSSEVDFNVGIGRALLALSEDKAEDFLGILNNLRQNVVKSLSVTNTTSLQDCHEPLLRFHVLTELEMISGLQNGRMTDKGEFAASMNRRLDILGPFLSEKQYILGLRRAAMQLCR